MRKTTKILILLLLLIPIRVNALTGKINLDCSPLEVSSGTDITCNVTASSDEEINGIKADIKVSDNLEYINFVTSSDWEGDGTGNKIGLYINGNVDGELDLGVLTIRVKDNVLDGNGTISLVNCMYSDKNFEKVTIQDVSTNVKIVSNNNKLSSLEVSPGTINFSPDTLEYNLTIDNPTVNITATKADDNSTISGDTGSKNLKYGKNTFKITVTSKTGEKRTYTLNITRPDNRSTGNKLSSLTVEGNNINFNEDKYTYDINVDYDTKSVKINANLKDKNSSFVKGYEPGTKTLKEGINKILLKVSAENGEIRTYTLNITRGEDPENSSDDNYLENIQIDNSTLDFSSEQEEYKITVPYDTDSININTIPSSNKSKVEISGNENLQVGENTVTIKVTSENGEVREYRIIVNKKAKDETLSNNNYLKSLTIENYTINFNKDELKYSIKLKNEEKLNITALPEDENANVTITGNKDLKNNSVIKITVTAEDGTKKEYKINIAKELEINHMLIIVVIEGLIIFGIMAFFMFRKRGKNNYEEEI